jgi:hypothetical protein
MSEWQPIETLPALTRAIVGAWITSYGEPFFRWREAHWYEWKGEREWSFGGDWHYEERPTHWMSLPEPPPNPAVSA